jgi:hypothetical protein
MMLTGTEKKVSITMRLGWHIPLPGPFFLSGTVWRSKRRTHRQVWHGTLPGWRCPHNHTRPDTAVACANRELARRQHATW